MTDNSSEVSERRPASTGVRFEASITRDPYISLLIRGPLPLFNEVAITINPGDFTRVSDAVYAMLQNYDRQGFSWQQVTQAHFRLFVKNLILKRVQEVYTKRVGHRPQHRLIFDANAIELPGPIADILACLGDFISPANGHFYTIRPIAQAAPAAQDFYTLGNHTHHVIAALKQTSRVMVVKRYPSPQEYTGTALATIRVDDHWPLMSARSYTNDPTPSDGLLRGVIEDAFFVYPANFPGYNTLSLRLYDSVDMQSLLPQWIESYITLK